MTIFTPKYIESKLYKTYPQRLRDYFTENRVYGWILTAMFIGLALMIWRMSIQADRLRDALARSGRTTQWEVQGQGQVGQGSMILNPNFKPQ